MRLLICAGVALASGAWGVYWMPQRALEAGGLTGGWATIAQYIVPVGLMLPVVLWRAKAGRPSGLGMFFLPGLLFGGGMVCYSNSFLLTDVVHTLLLFYLTPIWATSMELFVLRQRPPGVRALSIIMGLLGVWLVLGSPGELPWPENAGDWLALTGGALVAAGATQVQAERSDEVVALLFAFFFYGGLIALGSSFLLPDELGPVPSPRTVLDLVPALLALSLLFLMPTMGILIWSPSRIGAGVFGVLIMSEVVFGTASAALWADEPFGWREATGATLVIGAGLAEALAPYLPRITALPGSSRSGSDR